MELWCLEISLCQLKRIGKHRFVDLGLAIVLTSFWQEKKNMVTWYRVMKIRGSLLGMENVGYYVMMFSKTWFGRYQPFCQLLKMSQGKRQQGVMHCLTELGPTIS